MSTDDALRHGITRTAGVVTAAALVMVGVFSLFGTASSLDLKQAGVGLAVAVLLDATVIRGVLLPASMKLLGDWNWYLPALARTGFRRRVARHRRRTSSRRAAAAGNRLNGGDGDASTHGDHSPGRLPDPTKRPKVCSFPAYSGSGPFATSTETRSSIMLSPLLATNPALRSVSRSARVEVGHDREDAAVVIR